MSTSLKLISLNIERSKHLDVVLPFLEREQPDVVCLQEVLQRDIPRIESVAGPCVVFQVDDEHPADAPEEGVLPEGNAICTFHSAKSAKAIVYAGNLSAPPVVVIDEHGSPLNFGNRTLTVVDVEKDSQLFRIATTHFTWTPIGHQADDTQRRDMKALMQALDPLGELVLAGDFNTARGSEIFDAIAQKYKDNIPPECTTTIDKQFHRAGDLQYVVDGLFSTPGYVVSDVRLVGGVSDHMAVVATVSKS
ncbi:MAG: endonuclease/exonuclease/phosphatase family protein [Patescibacteria group bacterium]